MADNPILDELYAIRAQMLRDAEGNIDRLVEGIQHRESSSGREFMVSPRRSLPFTADDISPTAGNNFIPDR